MARQDIVRASELWTTALRRGLIVGSAASVASTLAIAARSAAESRSAVSATNAISHRLWGPRAKRQHGLSARYTLPGYLLHHASAMLWGVVYERWFAGERRTSNTAFADAAAVAGIAAAADYLLSPKRLRPGFEAHLSLRSLAVVYATFGAGLLGARYVLDRAEARRAQGARPWNRLRR